MVVPISLHSSNRSYDITIDSLQTLSFDVKVAVVTNPTVSSLHLQNLLTKIDADLVEVITVPDGEEYKNLDTIEQILDRLFELRFDRASVLIAFGGGVIGDMTGFAASIYQRGISFVQIPTTLLSQVDASVGGKTGVNNRFGKNLIGSFYQPKAVYIDIDFLKTLPKREFNAGVAEIVKMAVMFDGEFFNSLQDADLSCDEQLGRVIERSVRIKAKVVDEDEKERGIRAVLNYGHTFAHVIENKTEYKRYLHGEAVAIGMVMANELAVKIGIFSRSDAKKVEDLLRKYQLPTLFEIDDVDSFYESFFLDKKSARGEIAFVLPTGIGKHTITRQIDEKTVKSTLKEFGKGDNFCV